MGMNKFDPSLGRVVDYYYAELRVMEMLSDNPRVTLTKPEHLYDIDGMPTFLAELPDGTAVRVSFRDYNTMVDSTNEPQILPQAGDEVTITLCSYCWTSQGQALIIGKWEE